MKTPDRLLRRGRVLAVSTFLLTLVVTLGAIAHAAYLVQRPLTNGTINQEYLYGESGHKGVDFPAALNTVVKAVASGLVMDVVENIDNGTGDFFGNLVLIRHDARHYDRTTGQWGYVYSLYGHLAKNSVIVNEGEAVTAGQIIAGVDDTGNSSGNHLHLQIVLDPSMDQHDGRYYPWTDTSSRNPELWPF